MLGSTLGGTLVLGTTQPVDMAVAFIGPFPKSYAPKCTQKAPCSSGPPEGTSNLGSPHMSYSLHSLKWVI